MADQTLVLIGDSILDNAPYTDYGKDTASLLTQMLAPEWSVSRCAKDGATMDRIDAQLRSLKDHAAVAVLSIGGNDLTHHIGLLERSAISYREVLGTLLQVADDFELAYRSVAQAVSSRADRTILCTIYEVQLEPPEFARLARVPLALFNDRIVRTGARLGLDVLELRDVCTEPSDFVCQIEPSTQGARKIAQAIASLLKSESSLRYSRIFGGVQPGD